MEQPLYPSYFEGPPPFYPHITPVRSDRLYSPPSGQNAQGLFPPAACLFVGNLSTQVPVSTLICDLEIRFSEFGRCHAKIKKNLRRQLPSAFVQFENIPSADIALSLKDEICLHGRKLRVERAKGQRTAIFGCRNGEPVTNADVAFCLANFGSIESCFMETIPCGWCWLPAVRITYSYVGDYQDALSFYRDHDVFFMFEAEAPPPYFPPYTPEPVPAWAPQVEFAAPPPIFPDLEYQRPMVPISRSECSTPVSDSESELECLSAPVRVRSLWPASEAPPKSEPTPKRIVLRYPVKKGTKKRQVAKQDDKLNGTVTKPLEPEYQKVDENTAEAPETDNETLETAVPPSTNSSGSSTPDSTHTDSGYNSLQSLQSLQNIRDS